MKKICCFGELLLRMSPALQGKWIHKASMPVYVGGAELNVANALAKWELPVKYVSAVPDNSLSKDILDELNLNKIDTSGIKFSGNRIGIYFLPQGTDLKHAAVIYDRAHSSFASLKPGLLDWDNILDDVSWFHFSAISPALNEDAAWVCKEAVVAASSKGISISVDLNYRSKLWQYGKAPSTVMPGLVEYCDLIMGNIWSADSLLGIEADENIHHSKNKEVYLQHATETSKKIMQQFPKCKTVANTFRFDMENGLKYYATINNSSSQYISPEFFTQNIIDKVGSGDCFMAGLIDGFYNQTNLQQIINFSAAAAFGKLHVQGDSTNQTKQQILSYLRNLEL